ncbi:MAG: NCS2 family permease [Hornefia butyriciproducens]|uniref:NCS2 family permease n=1 Tax=Hornefia butyriciproducens TaxID=2652293 RepID=UPI002A74CFD8|nr:NCS2 family permease [Hornefia butyriciproducens]MDY2991401.1 NCS2 family permease [Hornefia butyriciproducens]
MEKFFKLKENGTDVRTEVTAGVTTFLAMVYILAVNPNILSASGMNSAAVFTATAVSAGFATLIMAFYANYPVALASGMGLNAYFAFSVCVPMAKAGIQDPWKIALAAVLCEGIIFILLSLTQFREKLVNDIPMNLKYGITSGIGLFIVIVGLKGAGIVIGDQSTLVTMGKVGSPEFVLAMIGLIIIAVLHHYRVKGDILIGILITWILGIIAQGAGWYKVDVDAGVYSLIPSFAGGFLPAKMNMFAFDFDWIGAHVMDFVVIVFSFLFVDIFDTAGTLIGVASKGNLLDENGKLPRAKQALLSDAIGTVAGACMGTSTVTSYVESSAGVASGGRTGLTSLTTGVLFFVSLLLSPIFLAIPSFATTPALLWVGLLMLSSVKNMVFDTDTDLADVVSGFMAIVMMPFTYSIANGIMFGMLSWVLLKLLTGKAKEINGIMWICFFLFVARIITLVV